MTALLVGAAAITIQILICKCHPKLKAKKLREDVVARIGDQPFVTSSNVHRQHDRTQTLSGSTDSLEPSGESPSGTNGTDYENGIVITAGTNPFLAAPASVSAPGQREPALPEGGAAEYEILSSGSYENAEEEDGRREYDVVQEPAGGRSNVQLFRNKAYGVNLSS